MLNSIQNENCYDGKIEPFPVLAIIDQESKFTIFDASEDSISQPEVRSPGQPFSIIVHPFGYDAQDKVNGFVRWRVTGKEQWNEEPLIKTDSNKWEGSWTPPDSGTYEWNIELWTGQNDHIRDEVDPREVRFLKVERKDLILAKWHQLDKNIFFNTNRLPIAKENDVFLLPVIFPQNQKGLIGGDSKGHYSMDNNITDSSSFGELTHKLASNGITLGMKFPIKCSNQHPFYLGDPHSFNDEGVMDLIGEGWESRRKKWENVFRFWIVQGVEIFSIPEITCFPLSFWDQTIQSLRKDFPYISFVTEEKLSNDFHNRMISAGFSNFETNLIDKGLTFAHDQSTIDKAHDRKSSEEIECTTKDENIDIKTEKLSTDKYLLKIDNKDPSNSRSVMISIKHKSIELSNEIIYYARDLANGNAYRWSGESNEIFLGTGQKHLQFLIEFNN